MLRVDPTLNHIPARREHVVSLFESINQPLVNIPNHGTAPTGAFLLGTRNEHGYYTVFVYLHQPDTRAVIVYVSEPRSLTAEQFRVEEAEAVRFVESMGFMVDSLHFRQLGPPEQDAIMARIPIFRPPVVTLDLYDVADESSVQRGADPQIFGSMGPGGNEVFRRAGLSPQQGGQPSHFSGPGSSPQQQMMMQGQPVPGQGMFGSATPSQLLAQAFPNLPPLNSSGMMPGQMPGQIPGMGLIPGPIPGQGMPGLPPPSISQQGMTMPPGMNPQAGLQPGGSGQMQIPGSNPANNALQQPREGGLESPEALERLGRLLAAFGIAIALGIGMFACKTTSNVDPGQAVNPHQADIDIGTQQLAERKWAEAITTFHGVLEEEPNDRDALRGMGLAYSQLGRLQEAEPFYRHAIEVDPKWSEPKNELAGVLISLKRCGEAEQLLRTVSEDIFYATPEFAEHNLALALSCNGKQTEAVSRLQTLLVKRPLFCLGYLTLSQFSLQTKQPEVAVKACEDFEYHCAKNEKIREQVTPKHSALCYRESGKAYKQMGDVESARTSFMRCAQLESDTIGRDCQAQLEQLPR